MRISEQRYLSKLVSTLSKYKSIDYAIIKYRDVSPVKVIHKCIMPILFLHGSGDTIVPIEHSKTLFEVLV